jgi:hypothetical protein
MMATVDSPSRQDAFFAMRQALSVLYYVGYFLSPLDFLNECLTFFLFKAAFKRFVFLRLFIFSSVPTLTPTLSLEGEGEIEGLFDQPDS